MNAREPIERIYLANNIYGRASGEIRRISEQNQKTINKVPDKGVGALNDDAIATSAGALESISVCRVTSLMKVVDELHLNGIKVFASEMTAEKKIFDLNFSEPCAIVMGSEDKGIFPALMKICDEQFSIPMKNDFESLNVSVAAGMILYEAMRQRT